MRQKKAERILVPGGLADRQHGQVRVRAKAGILGGQWLPPCRSAFTRQPFQPTGFSILITPAPPLLHGIRGTDRQAIAAHVRPSSADPASLRQIPVPSAQHDP